MNQVLQTFDYQESSETSQNKKNHFFVVDSGTSTEAVHAKGYPPVAGLPQHGVWDPHGGGWDPHGSELVQEHAQIAMLDTDWIASRSIEPDFYRRDIASYIIDLPASIIAGYSEHVITASEAINYIAGAGLDSQFQKIISWTDNPERFKHGDRIAKRLRFLVDASKAPGDDDISLGSLKYFHKFLQKNPNILYPQITITVRGNLSIQWTESIDKHFVIEFYPDGDVRFVIFAPNPKYPDRTIRQAGTATIDTIFESVERFQVNNWCMDEE